MSKVSIRFFRNREVRAVWDDETTKWWFCVVDVVATLSESADPRNYWYVLKNRLKKDNRQLLTICKGFKLVAPDGKLRQTDCLDSEGVIALAKSFPGTKAAPFLDWFLYSDNTIDGQSKKKAYALFESGILEKLEDVFNRFMDFYLADYMISRGKSGRRIFQREVSHSRMRFISIRFSQR